MEAVSLNYKSFGSGFPVIILHGLFGSLDNWQTIAKKLSEKFQVFIVDQRNHGKSPHSNEFNYELMTNDLLQFMQEHGIAKAHLIGHSMGGKTVMQFALNHPDMVEKLIVADIAPTEYEDRHSNVFDALFAAKVTEQTSREAVQDVLRSKLDGDETTVQFLMKNLTRNESGDGFRWKFNAESLWNNYDIVSGEVDAAEPFTNSTLFIKGEQSSYINSSNYADILRLFPNHELAEIKGAGHWVHAEKPQEFTAVVSDFLS
jgi:pimeloyl-ACP methyl ester carboxylesterase